MDLYAHIFFFCFQYTFLLFFIVQPVVSLDLSSQCCGITHLNLTWRKLVSKSHWRKYDSNWEFKSNSYGFWLLFFFCKVSLLEKYCSAGMTDLWAASSFKGSTSVYTCVPSTQRHVDNHLQWLKVAASLSPDINLQGITLTGWQR